MKMFWFPVILAGIITVSLCQTFPNLPLSQVCLSIVPIVYPCTCEESFVDGNVVTLFCDQINDSHLDLIMKNVSQPIISLTISNSNITILKDNVFQGKTLRSLTIRNTLLQEIKDNAFNGTDKSLEEIYLTNNSLQEIGPAFGKLRNLQIINLRGNQIGHFPSQILSTMNSLSLIDMSNNKITFLDSLPKLDKVSSLYLDNNMIEHISPNAFQNFPNLITISLGFNDIAIIPIGIFQGLNRIQEILLSHNTIFQIIPGIFENLRSLDNLDLSDNKLEKLEGHIFEDLKITNLNLQNNQLTRIEKDVFNDLMSLQKLDLSGNLLEEIKSGAFSNLTRLDQLLLSNNKLISLEEKAFVNLRNLQEIRLENNKLEEIHLAVLNDLISLPNLKLLNLTENQITRVPVFPKGINIQALYLSNNKIRKIDNGAFEHLKELQGLFLQGNELTEIEGAFRNMSNIKSIYLSGNKLKNIKGSWFQGLSSLLLLNMAENDICCFEAGVFKDLTGLLDLSLRRNKIQSLRSVFEGEKKDRQNDIGDSLTSLIQADFSENIITSITKRDLEAIKSLKFLYLINNFITEIEPQSFDELKKLYVLSLKGNSLQRFSKDVFQKNSSINTLDLWNCSIEEIEENAFFNLINLSSIYLGHNELSRLPEKLFPDLFLNRLFDLDLSFNHFHSIPSTVLNVPVERLIMSNNNVINFTLASFKFPNQLAALILRNNSINLISQQTFGGLHPRETMDLSFNMIQTIEFGSFDNEWNTVVLLEGNPLVCDCTINWMLQWFHQQSIKMRLSLFDFVTRIFGDVNFLTCQAPANLKNMPLLLVNPNVLCSTIQDNINATLR